MTSSKSKKSKGNKSNKSKGKKVKKSESKKIKNTKTDKIEEIATFIEERDEINKIEEQIIKDNKFFYFGKKGKKEKKKKQKIEKKEKEKKSKKKKEEKKSKKETKTVPPEQFVKIRKKRPVIGKLIEEKTGFGWKGLGSRRIYYDPKTKENRYEVIEPELNGKEIDIKNKLVHLFRVRADVDVFETNKEKKMEFLEKALSKIIRNNYISLIGVSKDDIYYYIFQDFVGYGKIDILMNDEGIEDISCDGHGIPIFIYHKKYESIKSNIVFEDSEELDSFVVKLSQMCGKQISVYEPVVDGKLFDGSRLQTTLAKTITKKSTFTIRRFREDPLTPIDLIGNNTMSVDMAAYFWMVIEHGASVLFCGGTASGKTTMLNALSLFLPSAYKIVSVEDTREINLPHENWIAGTTRTGFSSAEISKTGKDIDMFDLIRVALRQRPRAIIVGEVRGREAYSLFQAMTTGHLSYSTVHASDMHSLIQRLESPPIELPRALLTSLDLVVFLNNLTVKGRPVRRITNVTEIIKLDPETNRLVTMSPFTWISEVDDRFEISRGSRMLNKIRLSNSWDEKRFNTELQNRIKVLKWMLKKKIRSYTQVGEIISEYHKDPVTILKKVKD